MSLRAPLHQRTFLGILLLGLILPALDQSIVSIALFRIAKDLHQIDEQALVVSFYLIAVVATGPIYGRLSDTFGRKWPYVISITIFTFGSALCGAAWSMNSLAIFRGLQGVGGGGIVVLTLAYLGDRIEPRRRAVYESVFSSVFVAAAFAGPVLGGALAARSSLLGADGWRWIFLINVPIGLLVISLAASFPDLRQKVSRGTVDWVGAALLLAWLIPLVMTFESQSSGDAAQISVGGLICLTAGGLFGFVIVELRAGSQALLPVGLFLQKEFTLISLILFLSGCGLGGINLVVPLDLQIVRGFSPVDTGLLILPQVAAMVIGSTVAGQYVNASGRYKAIVLMGLLLVTMSLTCMWAQKLPMVQSLVFYLTGYGLGVGFLQPLTWALQNATPKGQMGVGTSAASFFSRLGVIIGSVLFLSLLLSPTTSDVYENSKSAVSGHVQNAIARTNLSMAQGLRNDPKNQLPLSGSKVVNQNALGATQMVMLLEILIHVLAFVVCLWLPNVGRPSLGNKSPISD